MSLTDTDCVKLTGFTCTQRTQILSHIPPGTVKNSTTRSVRSALAYLLMKLKLGLSNSILASMVGIDSKRQMGRIISGVRMALTQHFVSRYLSLAHITRQDVINKHTSPIARRLLAEDRDQCILILDETYLCIQVDCRGNTCILNLTLSFEKIEKSKQSGSTQDIQYAEEAVIS